MPSTRRRVLQAAVGGLAAGLAGCGLLTGSGSSRRRGPPAGDPVTGYETARHVVDDDRNLFYWTGEEDRSNDQLLVATPDERAAVAFDTDGDDPVSALLADANLEEAAVVLFQRRHGACRELRAFAVGRRPDEVSVTLCQAVRPADEACDVDDQRTTALALRLPFDARSLSEGLRVVESSDCVDRYGPREGET
jgi:hypothetical protein